MVVGMVLASSCGDECPVEQPYSVRVSVKDKNYLNISQFPQLSQVDENLPFRTYAGTLYYALYDASTGALIRESAVVSTEGEEKEYTLTFPGVPDGDYKLAVWGNLTTDYPAGILHQDGKEHTIQGVDISKYFSTGVGIGLDYYHELYEKGKGELVLPLFLNMKGYLPATETVSPFFSLDLGVGIGLTKGVDGMAGFICTPSVGVKLSHCTLQVGYNMQRNSEYGFRYTMGSIQMKLGYIF